MESLRGWDGSTAGMAGLRLAVESRQTLSVNSVEGRAVAEKVCEFTELVTLSGQFTVQGVLLAEPTA